MKPREIPVPATAEGRERALRACKRNCTICNVFFYIFLALAVIGFLGAIVDAIVFELRADMPESLCFILLGAFLGGGAAAAAAAVLFSRLLARAALARADLAERCSSERSFYVGEGTLATFEEDSLLLHGDTGEGKQIRVPYGELRLFSVCTRRAPREKGEWSVVLELPARYLAKGGRAERDEKILVETDAKARLFRTIEERGLTLLGEKEGTPPKKFRLMTKFLVPDTDRRRRSAVMTVLGALVAGAGIPVAVFWNATAGSFLTVIGFFLAVRCGAAFVNAKSVLAVYEEGIFWKDVRGAERIFLKWEEIGEVSREREGEKPALKLQCAYGAFRLPDVAGAFEYLREKFPDKCKGE